jgi:hypothetical protein
MTIVFSFDDNEKLNMKVADLFDNYGFKATLFINWEARPENTPMTRDDILDLNLRGFEIGAHAVTHTKLTELTPEGAYWQISQSQEYLEELIKEDVVGFCYPKGSHNENIERAVERCGYSYARTVGEGCTEIYGWDAVERCGASYARTVGEESTEIWWDRFKIVPTVQIYNSTRRRLVRVKENILNFNNGFSWNGGWKESAMKYIKTKNSIVHIWGHALEIEQQDLWYDLEGLLRWIRNKGYEVADGIRGLRGIGRRA